MKYFEYIDDYTAGKLEGDILKAFEAQLLIDPELKQLVDDYEPIKNISEGLLELDLLSEVKAVSEKTNEFTTPNSIKYGLLGLFLMTILYFLCSYFIKDDKVDKSQESNQYAANYTPPIWPISRSVDKDYIELGVSKFLAGEEAAGRSYLLDSTDQKVIGQYWLAELYLKDRLMDSVQLYLPILNVDHIKYNRVQKIEEWIGE